MSEGRRAAIVAVIRAFLAVCFRREIVRRSTRIAIVVGTVLVLINHGDALHSGDVSLARIGRMLLTYCVPYVVATYAAVQALRGG